MSVSSKKNYSQLDHPEISSLIFHLRQDLKTRSVTDENTEDWDILVDADVTLGAKLYMKNPKAPLILFFHGNGEIVSDYDDIGPIYLGMGISFLAVDYRGYGHSTGSPTVSHMMRDCHIVFKHVKQQLREKQYSGPLIVMGRSLGSASALEIAVNYQREINGLIIESGFAYIIPLLQLIGVDTDRLGLREPDILGHIDKIRNFHKPLLVIHAEFDHIIPFNEGRTIFEECPSEDKTFLKISGADHNSVFAFGMKDYLSAIKTFTQKASANQIPRR
jgi:alpha-beta hydrolase superfamily lysophospholipase